MAYLMTLSVDEGLEDCLVNNELERMWKKAVMD
jgi:hypothetical protein